MRLQVRQEIEIPVVIVAMTKTAKRDHHPSIVTSC